MGTLKLIHVELGQANDFVSRLHRHHKPVTGHRFSIGVMSDGVLCGVAVVGRPVARKTDQVMTVEVTRLCTDGTPNACSFLYSACARAATSLGYRRIQTFILETETGASLKAAGWQFEYKSSGGDWNSGKRTGRRTDQPMCAKQLWARNLGSV